MKVSVIIPAYNEGQSIGNLIASVKALYPDFQIIVIDDGSADDTAAAAQNQGAEVYKHPYNIGNGAAIKTGIRLASGDYLVFMDGDGQHDPNDISTLLQYLPEYDMVVGARLAESHASVKRAVGNTVFNRFASYVAKFPVKDLTSGFRAIKADIARNLVYLLPNTYSYPSTLTLGVLRSGRSVKYVPIQVHQRKTGTSNIKIVNDGVRFFMIITKICTLYSPMRVFLPVSFALFSAGFLYYAYTFLSYKRFTNMGSFLLLTSVIIFMMGLVSEQICQMRYDRSETVNGLKTFHKNH